MAGEEAEESREFRMMDSRVQDNGERYYPGVGWLREYSWDYMIDTVPFQVGPTCAAITVTTVLEEQYKIAYWRKNLCIPFNRLALQYVLDRGAEAAAAANKVRPTKMEYFDVAVAGILPVEHYCQSGLRGEDNWLPEGALDKLRRPRYCAWKGDYLADVYGDPVKQARIVEDLENGPIYCDFFIQSTSYERGEVGLVHGAPSVFGLSSEKMASTPSHAVPIVGLGTFTPELKGGGWGKPVQFYKYRNSYGKRWGENGYGRIRRDAVSSVWIPYLPELKVKCPPRTVTSGAITVASSSSAGQHIHPGPGANPTVVHATVNENSSGDVLAMRMQIQELKKEVSQLQNMANGGAETNDVDAWSLSDPESPGMRSFKWEGLRESFSSLPTSIKRMSQNDFEVTLVNAFRREKDRDIALQALTAECQAAMQLAKQKEAENQGLKMRLRLREAAIKRLEAVASGKIAAEPHLLKEKEEHLKEIDVLCSQVDRNQEITRNAMENLQLKEEIRRLKSFFEEGEREMMNEQITLLQNKLLEALDWKLMHESDNSVVQKKNFELTMDVQGDGNLLVPSKEPSSPWFKQKSQTELPSLTTYCMPSVGLSDQIELQTMVDAIVAASQREADSKETAIMSTKESDDLRMKLKQLIEDNNRLIELYEQAVAERHNENICVAENAQDNIREHSNQVTHLSQEKEKEMKTEVKNLAHQLTEMHEENEILLGLHEKAMQERDEFKRLVSSGGQKMNSDEGDFDRAEEKLVEVDGWGERLKSDESPSLGNDSVVEKYGLFISHAHVEGGENSQEFENSSSESGETEVLLGKTDLIEVQVQGEYSSCSSPRTSDYLDVAKNNFVKSVTFESDERDGGIEDSQIPSSDLVIKLQLHNITVGNISNDLNFVRLKLDKAQELLLNSSQTVALFCSLERVYIEINRQFEALEDSAQVKQQECESSEWMSSELQERRNLLEKKLMAIKYSISSFSSSIGYFERRELQARARKNSALTHLNQMQDKLARLQGSKYEIADARSRMKISELEFKNYIADMKMKLEEENRRHEKDKVLLSIDDVDINEVQSSLGGKATKLLRSTEEKSKLPAEITQAREKLGNTRKDIVNLARKLEKLDCEIQAAQIEVEKGLKSVEEAQNKLQRITREREALLEMEEYGKSEFEYLLLEYHQHMFEAELKKEEMRTLEEELQVEMKRVVEQHS